jgi:hypothetical protein
MSTSAVTVNPNADSSLVQYFQQRQSDLRQLGKDLQNGDLTDAQTEYNSIESLGQNGPFANGDAFYLSNRQQDFDALGQALQSGNLSASQGAFTQLHDTFLHPSTSSSGNASGSTPGSGNGAEIVLNLANAPAGEQITINLTSGSNGTEQIAISATNPDNSNPEQITLNLNPNSNQELVLNLFGNSTTQTSSTDSNSTQNSNGVSVNA